MNADHLDRLQRALNFGCTHADNVVESFAYLWAAVEGVLTESGRSVPHAPWESPAPRHSKHRHNCSSRSIDFHRRPFPCDCDGVES